jgi:hypothetical protein
VSIPVTSTPLALAVGASGVFWSTESQGMFRCDLPDCTGVANIAPPGPQTIARQLAITGSTLVWITGPDLSNGTVFRCEVSACVPEALAEQQTRPHGLAIAGDDVYWTVHGTGGMPDGEIRRVALSGGVPVPYVQAVRGPSGIALDDTHLYFTVGEFEGEVFRCERGPESCGPVEEVSPVVMVVDAPIRMPMSIAVSSTRFFFTNDGDSTVMGCPLSGCADAPGGAPEIIAKGQEAPGGAIASGGCVLWTGSHGVFGLRSE